MEIVTEFIINHPFYTALMVLGVMLVSAYTVMDGLFGFHDTGTEDDGD